MLNEIFPFTVELDKVTIAGACLWALALYISLTALKNWLITQLNRWFNFAERSLYISTEEFEKTRVAREAQNAFYASLFSIIPFLVIGILCNWTIELSLGKSWSISMGILTCMACGIYELGKQDGYRNN